MKLKRKVKKTTCFLLGLLGAGCLLVAGVLLAAGVGAANFLQVASFAFTGGMLLVLCTQEPGPEKRNRRLKLLGLFLMLLVANLRLPPLDWLEVAVLPLMAAMYDEKGDGPFIALVAVAEAAEAALRTLALTPLLGAQPGLWLGLGMVAVALARGALLLRLYRRAARRGEAPEEPVAPRLR